METNKVFKTIYNCRGLLPALRYFSPILFHGNGNIYFMRPYWSKAFGFMGMKSYYKTRGKA